MQPHHERSRGLESAAAWVSLAAGGVHGSLISSHFDEWWGYGAFFAAASLAQLVFGLALLTNAVNPKDTPHWYGAKSGLLGAGVVGNILLIGFYVVTRTYGIPFLGPEAGTVESVAPIDVLTKVLEGVLVVLLVILFRRHRASPAPQ